MLTEEQNDKNDGGDAQRRVTCPNQEAEKKEKRERGSDLFHFERRRTRGSVRTGGVLGCHVLESGRVFCVLAGSGTRSWLLVEIFWEFEIISGYFLNFSGPDGGPCFCCCPALRC